MYIMITDRCNMSCSHCVYSCTNEGEDMPCEMFKEVIERYEHLLNKYNGNGAQILIGGGEPTIHPKFWEILCLSISKGTTWLATNGKEFEKVKILFELAKKNIIRMTLSIDRWHEPINEDMVNEFKKILVEKSGDKIGTWKRPKGEPQNIEIRNTYIPIKAGRAKDGRRQCPCPRIHVKSNGNIYGCGCEDSPLIGTAEKGFFKEYESYIPLLKDPPIFRLCSKKWLPK